MSSEGTDQLLQGSRKFADESQHEPRMAPMLSYSRDFLLSLREKDVCKRLPAGFDSSLLSEIEEPANSSLEWQRSLGSSSLHTSKRSDYGPSSFSRVEVYSRGNNTRWDTRSSGSSDKDGNTLSDRDTFSQDSGRRSVSQYRRLGQKPEQDGLLGSGVFPRPSGYQGWATASKDRGEGHYQLNRSSEPYQPPRPYKSGSYSRKDGTDTYNDETFGSSESSNQNREEEERIRRESFELMRMEQRKVLQEKKQKKIPEKHEENDISSLLDNSECNQILKMNNNEKHDESAASLVSRGDFSRCSLIGNAPASRPLVPPGFGSTITETSINTQLSSLSLGSAVANVGTNESSLLTNGTSAVNSEESNLKKGSDSGSHTHFVERDPNSVSVPFMGDLRPPSAVLRFSDPSVHIEYTSYDASGVMTNNSNEEKITKAEVADTSRQVHSASILNKLFGNAMTENGGTQSVEGSEPDEATWSASQSSKFASWFLEDGDKRPTEDLSSRELLSLIVSKEKGESAVSTLSHERIYPKSSESTETSLEFVATTKTPYGDGISEIYYASDKPLTGSSMLTCEDLEQSILADVKGMGSNVPDEIQEPLSTLNPNLELPKANVDNQASEHLLSLLQKGAQPKDSINLEAMFTSGKHVGDIKADVSLSSARSYFPDDAETVSVESGKSLTLEALFGSAFMRELHSTEAPISEQRRLADDQVMAQSHSIPHPLGDTKIPSEYASKQENVNDIPGGRRSHTVGEAWIDLEQSRVKNFNAAAGQGSSSGIHLPEEENLISLGSCANPATSEIFHVENTPRSEMLGPRIPNEVDVTQNNERSSSVSVLEASVHGPHDAAWAEIAHQHLHGQSPPSQFPFSQINQMRPYLHHLDNPANLTPQMKFVGPENIHHDPQHRFLANVVHRHPFHGPGGPRFDPNFHLPIPPPPMPMPGGFAPHPLQYFPRGGPLPHTVNSMPVSMHEAMHNFQGHLNHGGYGMEMPGTAGISGHRPQLFARLMEMEAQQLNSQPPHLNPAGQSQVRLFDHELPPSLRYR